MVFIHDTLSVVEWIAVVVAGLAILFALIMLVLNLGGLKRYLKIKSM